ncbi:hypothetical protein BWZ22_03930 [Seonamhaeicola sp. S2-3]|jgi:hypothetical protein|nr:hypothetical protein BWZ22_03930 [Seonamhaeicola sp. S2-3]
MKMTRYVYLFDTDVPDLLCFGEIASDILNSSPGSGCEFNVQTKLLKVKNTELLINEIKQIFERYQVNYNLLDNK